MVSRAVAIFVGLVISGAVGWWTSICWLPVLSTLIQLLVGWWVGVALGSFLNARQAEAEE